MEHLFQYIVNDDKTYMKKLVSGHGIVDPTNPYEEFKLTKLQAAIQRKSGTHSIQNQNDCFRQR